jgi:putative methionine-R-sulfoxide reductase with GAF domain
MGVLDVDSTKHADFDDEDRHYLEEIVRMLLSTEKNQ